jgi:hypothetical protein
MEKKGDISRRLFNGKPQEPAFSVVDRINTQAPAACR